MITGFEKILLAVLLFVLMMGMGCTLSLDQFKQVLRKPKGIMIGFLSQYGWMPLIGFLLAKGFGLSNPHAIGLVLVACTPGGTTSNLFAFFLDADVALSISMTVLSSVLAVFMMPVLLWVYTQSFTSAEFSVPYVSIISTLAIMLVPLMVGLLIKQKRPSAAKVIEKVGSWAGIGVLLFLIATSVLKNKEAFLSLNTSMVLAAFLLGVLGMVLGLVGAKLMNLSKKEQYAVMFETGIQNSPLAIGIVLASFSGLIQGEVIKMPLLYALLVLVNAGLLTLGVFIMRKVKGSAFS